MSDPNLPLAQRLQAHPEIRKDDLNFEKMGVPGRLILVDVLTAMQDAEEIGGPEREQYVALMTYLAQECVDRARIAGVTLSQWRSRAMIAELRSL